MEANILHYIIQIKCFGSSYAACAGGPISSHIFSCNVHTSSTVHCAVVTLTIPPSGIQKLPINPFLCFYTTLRCIAESGWHQTQWTPAVWYLQQASKWTVKLFLGIMVIAHQGTLSFHYIKQRDAAVLSGRC